MGEVRCERRGAGALPWRRVGTKGVSEVGYVSVS